MGKLIFTRKANWALQNIVPQKVIAHWEGNKNVLTPEWLDFLHSAAFRSKPVKVTIEWDSLVTENTGDKKP
jgi:hypothetical protein